VGSTSPRSTAERHTPSNPFPYSDNQIVDVKPTGNCHGFTSRGAILVESRSKLPLCKKCDRSNTCEHPDSGTDTVDPISADLQEGGRWISGEPVGDREIHLVGVKCNKAVNTV
jgi:hypothetical protein